MSYHLWPQSVEELKNTGKWQNARCSEQSRCLKVVSLQKTPITQQLRSLTRPRCSLQSQQRMLFFATCSVVQQWSGSNSNRHSTFYVTSQTSTCTWLYVGSVNIQVLKLNEGEYRGIQHWPLPKQPFSVYSLGTGLCIGNPKKGALCLYVANYLNY